MPPKPPSSKGSKPQTPADAPKEMEPSEVSAPPPSGNNILGGGEPKVCLSEKRDGFIYYPSGNIAVNINETTKGRLSMFCADTERVTALATFDHHGVGAVCFASGQPQLVTTMKGFSLSDELGNMLKHEKWPRLAREPIEFQPNDFLKIVFVDRQDITVTFQFGNLIESFHCGEQLRRTDSYLEKVVGRDQGKYVLDVDKIRKSPKVYMKPGPHHQKSVKPGLGSVRVALKNVHNPELKDMLRDMKFTEDRLGCLNWTTGTKSDMVFGHSKKQEGPGGTRGSLGGTGRIEDLLDNDPVLSEIGMKFQTTMKRLEPSNQKKWESHRKRLQLVKIRDLDTFLESDSDKLIMVCVLADWQPGCRKWEYMLMEANYDLISQGSEATACMVKVDTGESRALNEKYNFHSVPMYLIYHKCQLVWASNAIVTKADVLSQLEICLNMVRKNEYLPANFQFHGPDNKLLDSFSSKGMATLASLAAGVGGGAVPSAPPSNASGASGRSRGGARSTTPGGGTKA